MTTQQPEALRLAGLLELAPENGVEPQTTEDAAAELRRQHARIVELEARIKTMAEEHADELVVAHLDGRMRAAQPAGAQQPAPSAAAHKACKPDMLVNGGALKLALNVLRRAGKHEVADELEATAQPAPTPQADSQPVPQGETNAQLDTDSNPPTPGQQRDVAGPVALGQPVGNGSDQAAGHTGAQGDKLLTVAERNIRSFLRSAVFKSESDREAALNCVDVLWEAARAPADSQPAQVEVADAMADTQPLAPTDAELDELRQANGGKLNFVTFSEFRTIARAVLEKWGTPAHGGEREPLEAKK